MKFYTIKANKWISPERSSQGFIELTLNMQNEWVIATNSPRQFMTPKLASYWYNINNIDRPSLGSEIPRIYGPKGGVYSIFTAKLYR